MWSPKQGFQGFAGERDWDVQRAMGTSQLRLTLTSGTPITTSDVTAAGTIYLTEYVGNAIMLPWREAKSGVKYHPFELPKTSAGLHEISANFLANSDWSLTSGSNYDVFCRLGSGGPQLVRGTAWSSDTARAVALGRDDTGRYVQATNWDLLHIGTIRGSGTNTGEDSKQYRLVSNRYNALPRYLYVIETDNSWTYSTQTIRSWNNDTTNRVGAVFCDNGYYMELKFGWTASCNSAGAGFVAGIGYDSTTAFSGIYPSNTSVSSENANGTAHYTVNPTAGYHYMQLCECGAAAGATTWGGDFGAPTLFQNGATGWMLG